MKTIVDTTTLADAVRLVARRLPARPPVAVLGGIQLTADGEHLTLTAGDFTTRTRLAVPAVVHEPGTVLVPGRVLRDLARTLPKHTAADLTLAGGALHVVFGRARVAVRTLPAEEYPSAQPVPEPTGYLEGSVFAQAVAQLARAAGEDETLPALTGIRLEVVGDRLRMTATDRYRVALREVPLARTGRKARTGLYVVSAKELKRTALDLRRAERVGFAQPAAAGQPLVLTGDGLTVHHQLLDIDGYPGAAKLLPKTYSTTVTLEARPLVDVINRVLLVTENNAPVLVHVDTTTNQLHVRGGFADCTQTIDTVDAVTMRGESLRIGFNPKILLDGLKAVNSGQVQLKFTHQQRPALLSAPRADRTALRYLLMPVRLAGGDTEPN